MLGIYGIVGKPCSKWWQGKDMCTTRGRAELSMRQGTCSPKGVGIDSGGQELSVTEFASTEQCDTITVCNAKSRSNSHT
jgi:hypothetical protein